MATIYHAVGQAIGVGLPVFSQRRRQNPIVCATVPIICATVARYIRGMPDPRSVYSDLREQRRADIAQREQRHRLLGYGQLACVGAAVAIVWVALATDAFSIAWVIAPAVVFTSLLLTHDRLLALLERRRRAERHFTRALARIDGD